MTAMKLLPQEGSWLLPVAGQLITRCCVDNEAVRLLCLNAVEVSVSQPFSLHIPEGRSYLLNSGGPAPALAPVLRVMRQEVRKGTAYHDGRLDIEFKDGSRINVPSSKDFEAWEATGPGGVDGLKIVSIPGGDLAIWPDRR
ncbi:MAG: DUF6188 family protein [Streptosporangiaceae bacterium]